jgi:predicted secreted protein
VKRTFRWLAVIGAVLATSPIAAQGPTLEDYDYENLELRGVGLTVGYVWPTRVEQALLLGLRGDLGYLGPNVRIVPGISFWSSRLQEREVQRLADQYRRICENQHGTGCPPVDLGEIRLSDLSFHADAQYVLDRFRLMPYGAAGLGVHFLNGRGEAIDGTFIEDLLDAITPSIATSVGVQLPLGTLLLNGEGRFVLMSYARHVTLSLGGTWIFPGGPVRPPSARP